MPYGDAMRGAIRRRTTPAAPGFDFNDRGALAGAEAGAYTDAAGYGGQANASYLGKLENFDASAALNNYAKGAWGSVSEGLNQTLSDLKGQAAGTGRFDSGFFDQDSGKVVTDVMRGFSNNIAQQSLAAAGMQQRNTEAIGQFGAAQQGIGNDLLMSRREEVENNYREEQERKRKRRSGIGSAIGGVLGAGIGSIVPGVGTAIGAGLGSALGGAF